METKLIYNCYLNKFFKEYNSKTKTCYSEQIEEAEEDLKQLIPDEDKDKIYSLKHYVIDHMQMLELDNMNKAMDFGILVGIEVQKIIDNYLNKD